MRRQGWTFVIWPHVPDRLRSFPQHLKKHHPKIQFTVEEEKDYQLPFLDVRVSKEGGRLLTSVHRKPTHTERCIPYHSHHHPSTTMGVLTCMRDRACSICHPTKVQQEMNHLNQVFQANGFPENLVKKILTTHSLPLPETPEAQQLDEAPKVHVQKTNHWINWEGTTVQRRAEGFWLRWTVEAIQIRKATSTWTWTVASSYPWSETPSSTHTPYPTLSPILFETPSSTHTPYPTLSPILFLVLVYCHHASSLAFAW